MSSCFFIGHRDAPESLLPAVEAAAEKLVVGEGVMDFYVGSRGNFDRLAARAVRSLMARHGGFHLYRVLAYLPAAGEEAPPDFTGTVYPEGMESVPRRYAILRSNRAMADSCDFLIAYAPYEVGNARRVLDYARRRGRTRIVEIKEKDQ